MSKILSYFILYTLCLLSEVYQTVSHSMELDENSIEVKNDMEMNVRFNLSNIVPNMTIGTPNPLQVHNMRKRAINPHQGSSWLKYVWRERQYKLPQMFLTNIRNLWAVDPAGGRHLFDKGVPYGTVYLIKTLFLDSIFPRIGRNQ